MANTEHSHPSRLSPSDHRDKNDPARRSGVDAPPPHPPGPQDVAEGFEHRDVGVKPVALSLLALAVSVAVVFLIVKWFNDAMVDYVHAEQRETWDDTRAQHLPPDPRLQPSVGHPTLDRQDMDALRDEQIGHWDSEERDHREGGLTALGWTWDSQSREVKVGEDLQGRVGLWLHGGATTQPTTSPTATPAAPAAAPTTVPTAAPTTAPAAEAPAKPVETPAKPADEPAKPASDPAKPASEPAKPAETSAKPADEPAKPASEPAKPADATAKPADEPAKPASEPGKPADEPAKTDK